MSIFVLLNDVPIGGQEKQNMEVLLISIFVLGYLAITLEHNLKVDKLIPALAMMALLWAIISLAHLPVFEVDTALKQLVPSHIAEIIVAPFRKNSRDYHLPFRGNDNC